MLLRHGASRLSGHLEVARSVASGLGVSGRKPTSRSKNCFDASPDSPLLGLVPKEQPLSSRTRRRVHIYYLGQNPVSFIGGALVEQSVQAPGGHLSAKHFPGDQGYLGRPSEQHRAYRFSRAASAVMMAATRAWTARRLPTTSPPATICWPSKKQTPRFWRIWDYHKPRESFDRCCETSTDRGRYDGASKGSAKLVRGSTERGTRAVPSVPGISFESRRSRRARESFFLRGRIALHPIQW